MNLNGDEKRIRQLFREMSGDDLARAPEFATTLSSAYSRTARKQNRTASLRFSYAVAILGFATLMVVILRSSNPQSTPPADYRAEAPTISPNAPPYLVQPNPGVESPVIAPQPPTGKRARRRRNANSWALAMSSLFAWQSPTASLMQTRDDELMRSLPRLGETLQTIKSFSPDEFN